VQRLVTQPLSKESKMIELNDTTTVKITICGNVEIITSGLDVDGWKQEATDRAVNAANDHIFDQLNEFADVNTTYCDWRGGRLSKHFYGGDMLRLSIGNIVAAFERRSVTCDSGGIIDSTPWTSTSVDYVPHGIVRRIEAIITEADRRFDAACDAFEAELKVDNERLDRDEAIDDDGGPTAEDMGR